MTMLRANFPDLYNLAIMAQNYLNDPYTMTPPVSQRIFDVHDETLKDVTVSELGGYDMPDETGEGVDLPEGAMVEGYDKTFTHAKYAKVIPVSYEARQDDPKALVNFQNLAKFHANAMVHRHEKLAAAVLTDGFATNGPDGQYLFDTDHPVSPADATQKSNLITTILDDAGVAVNEILQKFAANAVNLAGQPIDVTDWYLVVPSALQSNALKSVTALYGSASTNPNPSPLQSGALTGGSPIEVVAWKWLDEAQGGSNVKWYLIAKPGSFQGTHSLRFNWRLRPTTNDGDDIKPWVKDSNLSWNVPAVMRMSVGPIGWRHVIASNGTT